MRKVEFNRTSVSSSKVATILGKSVFKDVITQYLLDTKQIKDTARTEVLNRKASMGNLMEPVIKQAAENFFDVTLTVDKNRYMHDDYDYFRVEFDALDYENEIVYEFKNTEMDEDNIMKNYYSQIQFAMFIKGWKEAKLVYLRNGWELGYVEISYDDNFIEHMLEACNYYWDCVTNLVEPDPIYIGEIVDNIEYYKSLETKKVDDIDPEFAEKDFELLKEWGELKATLKDLNFRDKQYKGHFASKYGKFKSEEFRYGNAEYVRRGNVDTKKLALDYPEINLDSYRKPDTNYQRVTLNYKKPADEQDVVIKATEDLV